MIGCGASRCDSWLQPKSLQFLGLCTRCRRAAPVATTERSTNGCCCPRCDHFRSQSRISAHDSDWKARIVTFCNIGKGIVLALCHLSIVNITVSQKSAGPATCLLYLSDISACTMPPHSGSGL